MKQQPNIAGYIVIALLLYLVAGSGVKCDSLPIPIPTPTPEVSRVTYVYEKDKGATPPGVLFALREINEGGKVIASNIEVDIQDASGNTPPQYRVAVQAAKDAGLPALVVQAGDEVVRVIQSPTEEQVRGSVQ